MGCAHLIFGLLAGAAHGDPCKHRLFYLPQEHSVATDIPNAGITDSEREIIAASQLKILNYLDRFPQRPVFSEQATSADLKIGQFEPSVRLRLKKMIKDIFPKGFQIDPRLLTQEQTAKLVSNGGEVIQLMRGRLDTIHRVLADKTSDTRIFSPISKWFASNPPGSPYPPDIAHLIFGAREEEALKQVAKYFSSNPRVADATIIFGSNHNFSFYPELFPPRCIFVPSDFQQGWTGSSRTGPGGFSAEQMRSGTLATSPDAVP